MLVRLNELNVWPNQCVLDILESVFPDEQYGLLIVTSPKAAQGSEEKFVRAEQKPICNYVSTREPVKNILIYISKF